MLDPYFDRDESDDCDESDNSSDSSGGAHMQCCSQESDLISMDRECVVPIHNEEEGELEFQETTGSYVRKVEERDSDRGLQSKTRQSQVLLVLDNNFTGSIMGDYKPISEFPQ
jgi:hypothetical protein